MADLLSLHPYGHPKFESNTPSSTSAMLLPHDSRKSPSSNNRSPSPSHRLTKMKSTNALSDILASSSSRRSLARDDIPEYDFNTLRDPRIASTSDLSQTSSSHHPDLSNEVAALSSKLVQAINNQTSLDDTLSATRQELENAQERVRTLELENDHFRHEQATGVWVKKADAQQDILRYRTEAEEEKLQRTQVEKEKKNIEQELENLTAELFDEANKMVAAAKHECEAVEKKNEQLRAQIKDTEMLLASQQEQLTQLKVVMQEMQASKDEAESRANTSTGPSSPAGPIKNNIPQFLNTQHLTPVTAGPGEISPAPSTSFSHLVKTVCRTDIPAYEDFRDLLNQSRSSKPPSRVTSGSYGGLGVIGLASLTANNSTNGSTASLGNPNQNSSPLGSPQSTAPHVPLKETRFYKRVFTEDIEPALRLDSAPSISWLTRRSVVSSIGDGSLVIEPMSQAGNKYTFSCSMCGERRKGKENPRTHRFRTSDSETAQRYTICTLCLDKMRSCCEIVGYLRMILDGHIRIGDEEEEHEAWEETVRLRERIFWARIGGGVVPCHGQGDTSEKRSPMVEDQHTVVLNEAETNGVEALTSVLDPKRTSINSALLSKIKVRTDATSSVYATDDDDHSHYGDQSDHEAAAQLNGDLTRTLEKQPGTVNETRSPPESKKTSFYQHSTTRRGSSESDTHLGSIPGAF